MNEKIPTKLERILENMKYTRIGLLLIIVGVGLPLVLFPFVRPNTMTSWPKIIKGIKIPITDQEIVIKKGKMIYGKGNSPNEILVNSRYEERLAIPFKYIISIGFILILVGVGTILLNKYRKKNEE